MATATRWLRHDREPNRPVCPSVLPTLDGTSASDPDHSLYAHAVCRRTALRDAPADPSNERHRQTAPRPRTAPPGVPLTRVGVRHKGWEEDGTSCVALKREAHTAVTCAHSLWACAHQDQQLQQTRDSTPHGVSRSALKTHSRVQAGVAPKGAKALGWIWMGARLM